MIPISLVPYIPVLGPVLQKLLDLIPDPKARAQAEAELLAVAAQEGLDTRAANKAEAAHPSLFVSGWRPFIGWVCGAALTFNYIVRPLWIWTAAVWWPETPVPPSLDEMLWELMFAMLGLGGLRTFEKVKALPTSRK